MARITSEEFQLYAGADGDYDPDTIEEAIAAEEVAQASRCRVPEDPEASLPADLREALLRRVLSNLGNRSLPLGVQTGANEFGVSTVRVGGTDREVRRLEAPYRRVVVG